MKLAIYKDQQVYDSDFESFCDQNCIVQVLSHYEVKQPILYLDASLNLALHKDETKPIGFDVLFHNNWMRKEYQHKVQKYKSIEKNELELWEENKRRLREGIVLITGIDSYHLDYSTNYQLYHSNHKCITCGYTEDGKKATVIDCYEWKFKGDVALEQFFNARASNCPKDDSPYSGYPIQNEWNEVDDFGWSIDSVKALKQTVDATLTDFYERSAIKSEEDYYGISAMKKIYQLFLENKVLNTGEQIQFITNVRIVFLFLYTRLKLFRAYVKEAANSVNLTMLHTLLDSLEWDIQAWRKTVTVMLKGTVSINEKRYLRIADKIRELIELEEKRYRILTDISSILS